VNSAGINISKCTSRKYRNNQRKISSAGIIIPNTLPGNFKITSGK
jgi:hypothetical protein